MTCHIDRCYNPIKALGLCANHYREHLMEARRRTGDLCSMEGCKKPRYCRGLCKAHDTARRKAAPGPLPPVPPSTSYGAVHIRVRRARGPASSHPCARCGWPEASGWAYDREDPDEVRGWVHGPKGGMRTWSLDLDHYLPLCITCHLALDREREGQ